jgi:hypothetical protein
MKKMLVILAAGAVAVTASADITGWNWAGGVISPTLGAGTYANGALTLNNDLSLAPSFTGTTIDIADIAGILASANLDVAPLVPFGGAYNSAQVDSDASAVGPVWLVIDSNGGGIQLGDIIGLGGSGTIVDLRPGGPGNPTGTPQTFAGGDVTTAVTVIPEPATFGLMGVAALGMFLARKKARR